MRNRCAKGAIVFCLSSLGPDVLPVYYDSVMTLFDTWPIIYYARRFCKRRVLSGISKNKQGWKAILKVPPGDNRGSQVHLAYDISARAIDGRASVHFFSTLRSVALLSISSSTLPVPSTTQESGSVAMWTGMEVSRESSMSRPSSS